LLSKRAKGRALRGRACGIPSFGVPTYGKHTFLPSNYKDRLMAHNEDQLYRDAMKQIGQAFAMGCLAISKTRARKATKD